MFDEYRDYDLEPGPYVEYELEAQERRWIAHIQQQLHGIRTGLITDRKEVEQRVRTSINYLERLDKKIGEILENERNIGYHNDTLVHDFRKVKNLLQELNKELDKVDTL